VQNQLLTIDDAAREWGIPKAPLLRAAEKHGYLIRFGRSSRIYAREIPELIEKCRCPQKVPASSCEKEKGENLPLSSRMLAPKSAQARQIAEQLKSTLPNTSRPKTAAVVRLKHAK
jgi:hypothetical protein